jgi:SEC-C motif domain protein
MTAKGKREVACPCHSGSPYETCCAPFHRGEREAPDPTSLMRSRYAAFARGDADYLARTVHVDNPDHGLPRAELVRSLSSGRRRYPSLAILAARQKGRTGEVLFAAGITESGRDVSFVELSDFEHDGRGWRYVSGVLVAAAELGCPTEGLTIDAFLDIAAR